MLHRRKKRGNEVAPNFLIAARRRVWIAATRRFHCDWSSVSVTRYRVTRNNTARWVRVAKFNNFIETVDCVLMISHLLQKCAYDCLRSVHVQLDSVRHLLSRFNGDVQRDNLQFETVDLLLFFRICRGMALTAHFSNSAASFRLFDGFSMIPNLLKESANM